MHIYILSLSARQCQFTKRSFPLTFLFSSSLYVYIRVCVCWYVYTSPFSPTCAYGGHVTLHFPYTSLFQPVSARSRHGVSSTFVPQDRSRRWRPPWFWDNTQDSRASSACFFASRSIWSLRPWAFVHIHSLVECGVGEMGLQCDMVLQLLRCSSMLSTLFTMMNPTQQRRLCQNALKEFRTKS